MHRIFSKTCVKFLCVLLVCMGGMYGAIRLYYRITDGFEVSNITSHLTHDPRWDIPSLAIEENAFLTEALNQPYFYIGKGCQVYVFASADEKYVLKFFKYQRFRPKILANLFSWIPIVDKYREQKIAEKQVYREILFNSCKLAFEELQKETGILYLHLNKTTHLNTRLTLYDKRKCPHQVDMDQLEFLLQKKAILLGPYLEQLMQENQTSEAENLLLKIIAMVRSEHARGLEDDDHALMQNTGVSGGDPLHLDIGRFSYNPAMCETEKSHQELFSKMYRLRMWLEEYYPSLADFLEKELSQIIGERFYAMEPYFKPHKN